MLRQMLLKTLHEEYENEKLCLYIFLIYIPAKTVSRYGPLSSFGMVIVVSAQMWEQAFLGYFGSAVTLHKRNKIQIVLSLSSVFSPAK